MRRFLGQSTRPEIEVRASVEQYVVKHTPLACANPQKGAAVVALVLRHGWAYSQQPISGQWRPVLRRSTAPQSLERGL